tara:strand:+ start:2947 stop:3984 length:1038 start_codon:yes stop_codon:yes gene_type:complete
MSNFIINDRTVGSDHPPLVLAECGINHEGSIEKAYQMINAAIEAGAEAIKFQCHITDKEMIETNMKPGEISSERLWDIIKRCELSEEEELELFKYCQSKNIIYLSTPFSREAADRLDKMGVSAFKIGSGECNNYPLIEHISKKQKPIILSTGMNDISSIAKSVSIIEKYKCPLILLHCTSMYPTPYDKVRLGAITDLRNNFKNISIGLSDHSIGIATCLGAVALGASVLEKHFTVSRKWPGPDVPISIEPDELKRLIIESKTIWESLGGSKTVLDDEKPVIDFAYASIVSIKDIKKGEIFSLENIWVKRPGNGELLSDQLQDTLGKTSLSDIPINTQLRNSDIKK